MVFGAKRPWNINIRGSLRQSLLKRGFLRGVLCPCPAQEHFNTGLGLLSVSLSKIANPKG